MKVVASIMSLLIHCSSVLGSIVTVDGEEFSLASSGENEAESIREFLPAGQKLQDWTRLVSIRHVPRQKSPKDYIAALAQTYHASYPHMQFAAGGAKNEWFIDFIAYPSEDVRPAYVEWNFFVARKHSKKGIVVCQYAVRHYSTSIDDAFRNFDVRELRSRLLEKLKRETFEVKERTESLEPTPTDGTSAAEQPLAQLPSWLICDVGPTP